MVGKTKRDDRTRVQEEQTSSGTEGVADEPLSATSYEGNDAHVSESGVEDDMGDVADEFEDIPLFKEQEIVLTEAPAAFGFMQGAFSCYCEPCQECQETPDAAPVVVTALPSRKVILPKSGVADFGGEGSVQNTWIL